LFPGLKGDRVIFQKPGFFPKISVSMLKKSENPGFLVSLFPGLKGDRVGR